MANPQSEVRTPQPFWRRLFGAPADTGDADVVFPPGFLEALDRLRIAALKAAGGGLKEGHRLGAYRGGQLEFHDHRGYSPGDDLRYLDWNLYARLGKPFVKEFAREEAGAIHLLLDASASMALGTPSKWTFARRLGALFAHVAWSARDQARTFVFGHGVLAEGERLRSFPPRGSRPGTGELLEWLRKERVAPPAAERDAGEEGEGTHVNTEGGILMNAVRAFLREAPTRGRVFIVSDFWYEEREIAAAFQALSAAGFDTAALHVLAPEESAVPEPGELRILSLEETGEVELNHTPAAAARYGEELDAHAAAVEGVLRRRGGQYLFAPSDAALEKVLLQTLRRRHWIT
ncbi:MAG: DUF58 domain-containing protein [Planctomycetes bacterium]|nr:DUF58 domain-containing protein [Planctomycetota bacterium]